MIARSLPARQKLAVTGGDEIGADAARRRRRRDWILLGDADPLDGRVPRRNLAAKQADAAGADDGETDAWGS